MSQSGYVEQDAAIGTGEDDLPTYDDLVAQNGPNSRFGRWRGWIEKRAAERYYDITPEERERRRQRGWGNDEMYLPDVDGNVQLDVPIITNQPPTPGPAALTIQTSSLSLSDNSSHTSSQTLVQQQVSSETPLPPLPPVSNQLHPTHLKMHSFGSRFLPHTKSPIRCVLPLVGDRLILIGHDEGLSVLDMFPRQWTGNGGISLKGPEEAEAFPIWVGDSVFQISLLEVEDAGEGTPQGVVLLLVGPEPGTPSGKDNESLRVLRMYNLASLTSLAKWTISQKGSRPLDMRRPSNWNAQQTPTKKHRPSSSITRGLKSLLESPNNHAAQDQSLSYQALLSPSASTGQVSNGSGSKRPCSPKHADSVDSTWDVIDDLPLRWATDFVPLATPGSRLSSLSVLSYALWSGDVRSTGRGGRMLAIATKANILLYEAPKGERAFHFVKDFYTPLTPRNITFFQQAVTEVSRSMSDVGPRHQPPNRRDSTATVRESRQSHVLSPARGAYGPQLSLFVIFDKRSGWIRLADAAVGELELQDDGSTYGPSHRESMSPTSYRKSRLSSSFEPPHHSGKWLPPSLCDLPMQTASAQVKKIMLLTRGKKTHILPYPLPVSLSPCPPYLIITWKNTPLSVTSRVCEPPDDSSAPPFLQVIALGEMGVEAQERPFTFLSGGGKGKGKARADEVMHVEEDTGGDSGFLCSGGHWDRPQFAMHSARFNAGLSRSYSTDSYASGYSSLESEELESRMHREQGLYCWCRKGAEDFRVFWLGGVHAVEYGEEPNDEV
ncbi:hypothetical protein AAF712_002609 [Marasmius tenuissimus]|uniref:Uncharacterized protein n=1 Tax=Marasmius tenuissimus TaxID=585030 RepID=A0ABR3AC33_9AGAR|nr:hypothetical protein PM082_005863 [Marasmius tenuissimus]